MNLNEYKTQPLFSFFLFKPFARLHDALKGLPGIILGSVLNYARKIIWYLLQIFSIHLNPEFIIRHTKRIAVRLNIYRIATKLQEFSRDLLFSCERQIGL